MNHPNVKSVSLLVRDFVDKIFHQHEDFGNKMHNNEAKSTSIYHLYPIE